MGRTSAEGYDALLLTKMKSLISQSILSTVDDCSAASPLTLETFIKEIDSSHVLEQTLFEALAQSIDKRRLSRCPTIVQSHEADSDEEYMLASDRTTMRTAALNNTARNLRARQAANPDAQVGDALATVRRLGRTAAAASRQPTLDRTSSGFHVASNTDPAFDVDVILNQTDVWPTLPRRHRIPVTTAEHNDSSHLWNFAQTRRVRREADSDIRAAAELVDIQMRESGTRTEEGDGGWEIVPPRQRTLRRSNSIRRSGFRDMGWPDERDRSSSNPARHALARRSAAPDPETTDPTFTITDFPPSQRFAPSSPRPATPQFVFAPTSPPFSPVSSGSAQSPRSPQWAPTLPTSPPPRESLINRATATADDFANFALNRRARMRDTAEEMLGSSSSALHLGVGLEGDEDLGEDEQRRRRLPASTFAPSRGAVE